MIKTLNTNDNFQSEIYAFQHDFINIFTTFGGFIESKDFEGLEKYYNDLKKDLKIINTNSSLNSTLINNPGIYNLLLSKKHKADSLNVNFQLDFFFDLNKLNMPIYDFSRILGILLDNAIEASSITTEKKVAITFRNSSNLHMQIIEIENSYKNKSLDISEMFKKGVTEKSGHLGIGLWEVNKLVKRNKNIFLNTSKTDKIFKQTLEISY